MIVDHLYEIDDHVNIKVLGEYIIEGVILDFTVKVRGIEDYDVIYTVYLVREKLKAYGSYEILEEDIIELKKQKCPRCDSIHFELDVSGNGYCAECSSEYTKYELSILKTDEEKILQITERISQLGGRLVESKPARNVYTLELYPKMTDINAKIPHLRRVERTVKLDCYIAMGQFFIEGTLDEDYQGEINAQH